MRRGEIRLGVLDFAAYLCVFLYTGTHLDGYVRFQVRGWAAVFFLKDAGEILLVGEAAGERDLAHGEFILG